MSSNCLIFILTGVFIACRPTTSKPVENLRTLNEEIQNDLNGIIEQSPVAQNLNTTSFHIPVLREEKNCAMLRLKAFIKLLDQVKIEDEKELKFRKLYRNLQGFDYLLSKQKPKHVQKCETEEYQHHEFKEILKDLRRLMEELYCLQGYCH